MNVIVQMNCNTGDCGCTTPSECTEAFDDFNRADNTDLDVDAPIDWTEESGTWEIASNHLVSTGAGFAYAAVTSTPAIPRLITVKFERSENGAADLILCWNSSNDFVRIRALTGSGSLTIDRIIGGSVVKTITHGITISNDIEYTMGACIVSDGCRQRVTAYLGTSLPLAPQASLYLIDSEFVVSGACGVGSDGETVTFDDFKSEYIQSGCKSCGQLYQCTCCNDGFGPDYFEFTLSGMAALGETDCVDCASFDKKYVLNRLTEGGCFWRYEFPEPICEAKYLDLEVACGGPGGRFYQLLLKDADGMMLAGWTYSPGGGGGMDCLEADEVPIPFTNWLGIFGNWPVCIPTESSGLLTAWQGAVACTTSTTTTTTPDPNPWWCLAPEGDGGCLEAECLQMSEASVIACLADDSCVYCEGDFPTLEECLASTSCAVTTTTTTPPPVYNCCGEVDGDCYGPVECVTGDCPEGAPNCGGPFMDSAQCEIDCVSLTTTTTCDPELTCPQTTELTGSPRCMIYCPGVPHPTQLTWTAVSICSDDPPTGLDDCECQLGELSLLIGDPCSPFDGPYFGVCCNTCEGADPCSTPTTPSP